MTTIDAAQWKAFAGRFSKQHDGWSASLQLRQSDGGVEMAVDDRPFRGVTFDPTEGGEPCAFTT